MEIWARAPLRLGLAGGGSDLPQFVDTYGGAVINATINRFVNVRLRDHTEGGVRFSSYDTNEVSESADTGMPKPGNMPLFWATYERMTALSGKEKPSISIESFSDSPVGSGLGTSSALCVALVKAFDEYWGLGLSKSEIAWLAYDIERIDCGFSGGMQDQFAAVHGGFNLFRFKGKKEVEVVPIHLPDTVITEFETAILLHYSGQSRYSSRIIDEQDKNIRELDAKTVDSLKQMRDQAEAFEEVLRSGSVDAFAEFIREGWEAKKRTASSITNEQIQMIMEDAFEAGASAAKVSGAGGGGFVLFIVPFEYRNRVIETLEGHPGTTTACRFTSGGVVSWRK